MKMKIVKDHKPLLADKDPIQLVSTLNGGDNTKQHERSSSASQATRSDKRGIAVGGLVPEVLGFGSKRKDRSNLGGDSKKQKRLAADDKEAGGEGKGLSRAAKKRLKLRDKQQSNGTDSESNNKHIVTEKSEVIAAPPKEKGLLTLAGRKKRAIDDVAEIDDAKGNSMPNENSSAKELEPSSFSSIVDILNLRDFQEVKDAIAKSRLLLGFIVQPLDAEDFYSSYWDKECATSATARSSSAGAIKGTRKYNKLFSIKKFFGIIEQQLMSLGADLALLPCATSKKKEAQAKPIRTEGQIKAAEARSLFTYNCTGLRILQPQKYDDVLWKLLSILETEFGTAVSCNATLLPAYFESAKAGYQLGDMYVLQIEGCSSFEVFKPETGKYPVDSVEDVNVLEEKLVLETMLSPGDFLYVPAGWIFTHSNTYNDPSLSLRIDVGEGNTMCGFLDMLLPHAMKEVFTSSAELRRAMPRQVHGYMGVAYSENDTSKKRKKFFSTVRANLMKVVDNAVEALDTAVDQHTKEFILARLPVPLDDAEEMRSAHKAPKAQIFPYTKLRVLRPGIARALIEDGKVVVYHCMDNGRERFSVSNSPLEFDLDDGPALEELLSSYPMGVTVEELPHPSEELDDKLSVAQALYSEGLLVIEDEASRPDCGEGGSDSDDPF